MQARDRLVRSPYKGSRLSQLPHVAVGRGAWHERCSPQSVKSKREVLAMTTKLLVRMAITCVFAIATAGSTRAQSTPCGAGCGAQKVACLKAARGTKLSCGLTCRQSSAPTALGTCMRACASTFRGSKATCSMDHSGCIQACSPPSGGAPTPCPATCGKALASCAQGVVATAQACLKACRGSSGHGACAQACTAALQSGQSACQATFQTCIGACPTSPSGAFLN
jgi:hypothetical protein